MSTREWTITIGDSPAGFGVGLSAAGPWPERHEFKGIKVVEKSIYDAVIKVREAALDCMQNNARDLSETLEARNKLKAENAELKARLNHPTSERMGHLIRERDEALAEVERLHRTIVHMQMEIDNRLKPGRLT
jgi:hypothetical protein